MFRKLQNNIIEALGGLFLTALVFMPGDSLSESDHGFVEPAAVGEVHSPEAPSDSTLTSIPVPDSDLGVTSVWFEIAERLEGRDDYAGVLKLMDRTVRRESGVRQAEARLWRAKFVGRRGLIEVAGAELDSLSRQSAEWPPNLRLAVAEATFDLGLQRNDINAARAAFDLREACRAEAPGIDTLDADYHLRLGAALLSAGDFPEASRHFEAALTLGLPEEETAGARYNYGLALSRADSTWHALDVLGSLLDDAAFLNEDHVIARQAMLEYADVLYRAGDYDESRRRYEVLLPLVTTPADSGWIILQLGDAAARLGGGREAYRRYMEYLNHWPAGTWAAWAQSGAGDVDTTNALAGASSWNSGDQP